MKKILLIVLTVILGLYNSGCFAQTKVKISKPHLELKDNYINIYYDILNSSQSDKFNIWVELTDSSGYRIDVKSLFGDLGENISGGNSKKITLDLTVDSIYLYTGIFVQIYAELLKSAETSEKIKPARTVNRSGAIFQSVLFPGWGLSRIYKGKPHWLKGVAGYGFVTAAVIYNKQAISSYKDYLNTSDLQEIENFYNNSVKRDNISEICAYAAIGIWVTDLVWTIAGSSKPNNNPKYSHVKGFSIEPEFEPAIHVPILAIRYSF